MVAEPERRAVMAPMVLAGRRWRKLAEACLAKHDISSARASALVWVHRLGGGVNQITLASYVGIEGPTLVRLLDELGATGLVLRKEHPKDRRAKTIWLTLEGARLAEDVERIVADLEERALADVCASDIDAALRVFDALNRAASKACAGSAPITENEAKLVGDLPTG